MYIRWSILDQNPKLSFGLFIFSATELTSTEILFLSLDTKIAWVSAKLSAHNCNAMGASVALPRRPHKEGFGEAPAQWFSN